LSQNKPTNPNGEWKKLWKRKSSAPKRTVSPTLSTSSTHFLAARRNLRELWPDAAILCQNLMRKLKRFFQSSIPPSASSTPREDANM